MHSALTVVVSSEGVDRATRSAETGEMVQGRPEVCVMCRLSERQTPSGGLCGRPEKLQDVSLHFLSLIWSRFLVQVTHAQSLAK